VATRLAGAALILTAALWSLGMGDSGGGGGGGGAPIPDRNFTASLTDNEGNAVEAERFTWEGKVHFRAAYGNATITLPFEKLRRVTFKPEAETVGEELILATAELRTGETLDVAIDRTTKCYGETRFGSYEIFVKDVAEIAFQ